MTIRKKIKVLVVDDSLVFREVLARGMSSDPFIQVVATAADPFEARDKIIEHEPDVMTCDVQMPRMNGIEFLRRLLPQYVLPVVVVSTISEAVFDALDAGAVDFVLKPEISSRDKVESFINELITKVKVASVATVNKRNVHVVNKSSKANKEIQQDSQRIIGIGASTGGTEAIVSILKNLPSNIPGIAIVQHIPIYFPECLQRGLITKQS